MSVGINHASNQSIRPFKSSEEYIYAMKEDLAEWLGDLYDMDIDACNILKALETGTVLCEHANIVTQVAGEFIQKFGMVHQIPLPTSGVTFVDFAQPATFLARDNISNFIDWCRTQMDIKDVLMFETNDLVQRKNEKNVVLCLLEVARRASRFGMAAPVLIQLEDEIEEEMREDLELPLVEVPAKAKPQRRTSNTQNLDQMVQHLISRCTCPIQFPMVKVSEGKYKVGDSNTIIFIRILRNHVMVRVGGGWDTLEHYLDKHDPCRCNSLTHKLTQRPSTPVHEIKGRLSPRPGRAQQPATLLLSRHAPAAVQSVVWTPTATGSAPRTSARARGCPSPDRGGRTPEPARRPAQLSPSGEPEHRDTPRTPFSGPRVSFSPNRELRPPSPGRMRQSTSTPTLLDCQDDSQVDAGPYSSRRTGREARRSTPASRLTSSLPRPVPRCSTPQPQKTPSPTQPPRAKTPLVFQRTPAQLQRQPQSMGDGSRFTQTWTKSQFVSKLRQSSMPGASGTAGTGSLALQRQAGCGTPRPANPLRGHSPLRYTPDSCLKQPSTVTKIQEPKEMSCLQNRSGFIRTFCPSNKRNENSSEESFDWCSPPTGGNTKDTQHKATIHNQTTINSHHGPDVDVQTRARHNNVFETRKVSRERDWPGDGEMKRNCLFVPAPISPAQEASLYQSLEHEILANLQQLSVDSDSSSAPEDDPEENSRRQASWNELERRHGGLEADSARPKRPSSEAGYDGVVAELSQGKRLLQKVCLESWVSSSTKDQSVNTGPRRKDRNVDPAKAPSSSSWSSVGSSVESMKQQSSISTSPVRKKEVSVSGNQFTATATSNCVTTKNNSVHPDSLKKFKAGYVRQRRTLRKPNRVPSIYKLKLRPRGRPRHDHRPGKKPSRIPTPISYRDGPLPEEDPGERRRDTEREAHTRNLYAQAHRSQNSTERYQKQWSRKLRAETQCQSVRKETVEDQQEESWV